MKIEPIETGGGRLSRVVMEAGERIAEAGDFLDLLALCPTDTLVLEREALAEDFFVLRSGLAGEILQKVSNYRRRLVILGDFSETRSPTLRDFIWESNRGGRVVFAPGLPAALGLLSE